MPRNLPASPPAPAAGAGPSENLLVALAILVIFNVILSNSVQEALFLSHHPRERIPLAMFLGSLVTAAAATLTSTLLRVLTPARAARLVLLCLSLGSFGAALWNLHPGPASSFGLFLFAELATTLGFAVTWTYFQAPLGPSEIRRLMPRLSALSGIGGLLAGVVVPLLLSRRAPPQLLIGLSSLVWLVCAALINSSPAHGASRRRPPRPASGPSSRRAFAPFVRIPLLTTLALSTALVIWAGLLVQYETRVALKASLEQPDQIARVMAFLLSAASVTGIAVQLFVAPRLLEGLGVGAALAVLPALTLGLLLGYLWMPALPLLAGAFWADKTLRANLNRPAESCLLAALSPSIRPGITLTLSAVLTPLLKAVGAILLFALQPVVVPGVLLAPVLGMSTLLLLLSRFFGPLYARALGQTLEEASVESPDEALAQGLGDDAVLPLLDGPRLQLLLHAVDQGTPRSRQLALDLLRPHRAGLVRAAMEARLSHERQAVRIAALRWFAAEGAAPDAALLLRLHQMWQGERHDPERLALLEAAGPFAEELIAHNSERWIQGGGTLELQKGVLRVLLRASDQRVRTSSRAAMERLLSSALPSERCAGLELLSRAAQPDPDATDTPELRAQRGMLLQQVLLHLQDIDVTVRRCAVHSLAAFPDAAARGALLSALDVPALSHTAARTLGGMPEALDDILRALQGPTTSAGAKLALLRAAGILAAPRSLPVLLDHVDRPMPAVTQRSPVSHAQAFVQPAKEAEISLEALRSLNLIRRDHPHEWRREVRLRPETGVRLREFVLSELRGGLNLLQCRDLLRLSLPAVSFVTRELDLQIERAQRRVLYALQLLAPPETLAHVFRALRSPSVPPAHRDQARELLRALFRERPVREGSLKLLDESSPWSPECFGPPLGVSVGRTAQDAVRWLVQNGDPALRGAVLYDPDCPTTVDLLQLRSRQMAVVEEAPLDPSLEMLIFLKDVVLFESLTNQQLASVARLAQPVELPAQHVMFRQGERPDDMYLVVQGRLSVKSGGREVARLGAGECAGEMGVLSSMPRSATVTTLEPCRLLRFDGADFIELLDSYPEICRALLRSFIRRLQRAGRDSPELLATITGMVWSERDSLNLSRVVAGVRSGEGPDSSVK